MQYILTLHIHRYIPHNRSSTEVSYCSSSHPSATSGLVCCFPDSSAASTHRALWLGGGQLCHLCGRAVLLQATFSLLFFSPTFLSLLNSALFHPLLPTALPADPQYVCFTQLNILFSPLLQSNDRTLTAHLGHFQDECGQETMQGDGRWRK